MLSTNKLKNYALLRDLSLRDIEAYCDLTAGHISQILNGERPLTEENHRKIADAINSAYAAKLDGTFRRTPLDENKNAVKGCDGGDDTKPAPKGRKLSASK